MFFATGVTRRFHAGMVSRSQSSAFQASTLPDEAGRSVAASNHRSAKRTDSSTACFSSAVTFFAPLISWLAMRWAMS